jgi:hypothetical protein
MEKYTYILAPHTAHNFAVLQQAVIAFPDLLGNSQIGNAYPKSAGDLVDSEGALKIPSSADIYIYVKADTLELEASGLLAHVQEYQLFNVNTQPKEIFWLNVQ